MHVLFEDADLKITSRTAEPVPQGGATLLSFTGVGHAMGGMNVQKAEFFGAGRRFDNTLFLTDKTRSWGNRLDFEDIARRIAPFAEGTEVCAIGNSMGGFLAIVASRYLALRSVVALVPQFSVDPAVVPWETRWSEYRAAIARFHIPDVTGYFRPETQYFLFSGYTGLDRRHARLFPVQDNVHHYIFPAAAHGLAVALKEDGALEGLIGQAIAGGIDLAALPGACAASAERLSPA